MQDGYFAGGTGFRQVLLWSIATRQGLERWESSVASAIRLEMYKQEKPPGQLFWAAEIDRHWTLVAARNLLRALTTLDLGLEVDKDFEAAIVQHRDLLEHWDENMPVFNVSPNQAEPPRRSGKSYAQANPESTPYGQIRWNSSDGPVLGSRLSAIQVHEFLDDVQERVKSQRPSLASYIPSRAPSPWLGEDAGSDRWFPFPEGGRKPKPQR